MYTSTFLPIIVGFDITPKGLVERWEREMQTGDFGLQYSTVTALDNFAIEDTHPGSFTHWIAVLTQSGQTIVSDQGAGASYLVSGHVDKNGKFYYSCRSSSNNEFGGVPPADKVAVYDLSDDLVSYNTAPIVISADPIFVASICN